jgi:hypothetical protein
LVNFRTTFKISWENQDWLLDSGWREASRVGCLKENLEITDLSIAFLKPR